MRIDRIVLVLTVAAIEVWSTSKALGDSRTFYFEGYVDFIHEYLELDESVFVGAPFSGNYTFDPTGATDAFPDTTTVGYYYLGTSAHMSVQIGNYEFITPDLGILIWNDRFGGDLYEATTPTPFAAAGTQWSTMRVLLLDQTRAAFNSDALVTTVPDLSAFPSFRGLLLDLPGDDTGIRGMLTSLTPEPGSLALLIFGTGSLMLRRRR